MEDDSNEEVAPVGRLDSFILSSNTPSTQNETIKPSLSEQRISLLEKKLEEQSNQINELNSSTRPTSFQKMKYRKDAKGNLILKKKMAIKRTKHHVYFMDDINKKKPLVTTIEIESYKKYNLEGDEEIQEETVKEEDKQPLGETQVVKSNGCCCIL